MTDSRAQGGNRCSEAKGADKADQHVLTDIVDDLHDSANGSKLTAGEVIDRFEDRGIGALCAIVGLMASFPLLGVIPGVSILTGALMLLYAGQYVLRAQKPLGSSVSA